MVTLDKILEEVRNRYDSAVDSLRPPVTSSDEQSLRDSVGEIPESLLGFLRWHDGENLDAQEFVAGEYAPFLGALQIAERYSEVVDLATKDSVLDLEVDYIETDGPVRSSQWCSGWIPFWDYDVIWAIDLSPAAGGILGQVISVDWEGNFNRVEADSLDSFFQRFLTSLEQGRRELRWSIRE